MIVWHWNQLIQADELVIFNWISNIQYDLDLKSNNKIISPSFYEKDVLWILQNISNFLSYKKLLFQVPLGWAITMAYEWIIHVKLKTFVYRQFLN